MRLILRSVLAFLLGLPIVVSAVAEEVRISADGLTLLADWESTAAAPRQAVLLLHGTMAHKDMEIVQTLQDGLLENDIGSLAISLSLGEDSRRGMRHCESLQNHRHADAYRELDLWMEWLRRRGVEKIWLLGHSRGGSQIAAYALRQPANLAGLILVAPPAVTGAELAAAYEKRFGKSLQSMLELASSRLGTGEPLTGVGFLHCESADVSPESFLSYYRDADLDTLAMVGRIDRSVLLVSGSEDRVSARFAERAAELRQANIRYLDIEGADHFFRDLYADEIVDAIVEILDNGK